MNTSVFFTFALLACLGTLCSAQMKCYECSYDQANPKDSDCWRDVVNAPDSTEVDCASYCYSETFQSGGPNENANYWYIRRGCAGAKDTTCSDSDNCHNDAWGACKRCCSGELCNVDSPSGSNMVKASLLVALFAAVLAKWLN
ncbi:uncharacterized protein LOC119740588 [Patiria miniata]|uniref:Uncharacterized protein n=1 Tax=Patiria miniata TaxID=46514 RepID=A0A914B7S8_PATMI|nr:uncharacterized protein LOC119740588 [Patiria miniata]XP_038071865.1 uncharacterized protein LOC119740588 [Patiria miniata]